MPRPPRSFQRAQRQSSGSGSGGGDVVQPPPEDDGDPGDPAAVARIICLRKLNQRAYSRAELAAELARRGVPGQAADSVLDRFTEVGLIDDAALAANLAAAQHRERGLARRAINAKLLKRGLGEQAGTALSEINSASEAARARQLVERRAVGLSGLPAQTQVRRLVGLLARKGYPAGMSYAVVREVLSAQNDPIELDLESPDVS